MNDYLRHLKNLAKLPKQTLDEQATYWEVLEYELNHFKRYVHHPATKVKFKVMKVLHPQLFKDFQNLHKANKAIDEMLRK